MKIGIINYGMGNLGSVRRAFEDLGADVFIVEHPSELQRANRIVLPGVGAFSEGMKRLREGGWIDVIVQSVIQERRPLLGICLGMQMLAASGEEGGVTPGLQLIRGRVRRIDSLGCTFRIPHVGWNCVNYSEPEYLFNHIPQDSDFYFVHSYAIEADRAEDVVATTTYGLDIAAAVRNGNVMGAQFHPEKSSKAGRQFLRNFMDFIPC